MTDHQRKRRKNRKVSPETAREAPDLSPIAEQAPPKQAEPRTESSETPAGIEPPVRIPVENNNDRDPTNGRFVSGNTAAGHAKPKAKPPAQLSKRRKDAVLKNALLAAFSAEERIALTTLVKEQALAGCRPSQKMAVERLVPALKPVDAPSELPLDLTSAQALGSSMMKALADGLISTSQAKDLTGVLKDVSEMDAMDAMERMGDEMAQLKESIAKLAGGRK